MNQPTTSRLQPGALAAVIFAQVTAGVAAETVHFTHRGPRVGQQARQDVRLDLKLLVTLRQGNQVVHASDQRLRRVQDRTLTVLKVDDGRAIEARIFFASSEESNFKDGHAGQPIAHAVAGKTYVAARPPEGPLKIVDLEGNPVPPEEAEIVATALEALGRPNPLATLLAGRTVQVGETIALPRPLANDMLGFREAIGEVSRFDMTLRETQNVDGQLRAVFDAAIDAASPLTDGGRLSMQGRITMETDTCRVVATEFRCPIQMTETRGPQGARFTVEGRGSLQVAMQAQHAQTLSSTSR